MFSLRCASFSSELKVSIVSFDRKLPFKAPSMSEICKFTVLSYSSISEFIENTPLLFVRALAFDRLFLNST